MNIKDKVEQKAVYIGLATFSSSYIGLIILGNLLGAKPVAMLFWLQIILLITSGYVAGRLAKLNGWLNGLMVGVAAPIVLSIGMAIATMQLNMASQVFSALGIFWLVQSVILCSFGGFVWDIHAKLKSRNP